MISGVMALIHCSKHIANMGTGLIYLPDGWNSSFVVQPVRTLPGTRAAAYTPQPIVINVGDKVSSNETRHLLTSSLWVIIQRVN